MTEPVFLPLMREDMPDTAERVRRAVQAIPWALPEIRFRETEIRKMTYVGQPRVFRIKDEEPNSANKGGPDGANSVR